MVEFPALAVVFLAVLPSVASVVLSPSGKPLLSALAFALGFLLCTQRMSLARGRSRGVPVHKSLVVLDVNGVVLKSELFLNLIRAQTLRSERPNPLIEKVHFSLLCFLGSPGACPVLLA